MPLSQQDKAEYTKFFKQVDTSNDGYLSKEELGAVLKSLGFDVSEGAVKCVFDDIDKNKDNKISLPEFLDEMGKVSSKDVTEADLRRHFQVFDKDGSGTISQSELRQVLQELKIPASDDDIARMIKEADTDGDGSINFNEFLKVWHE